VAVMRAVGARSPTRVTALFLLLMLLGYAAFHYYTAQQAQPHSARPPPPLAPPPREVSAPDLHEPCPPCPACHVEEERSVYNSFRWQNIPECTAQAGGISILTSQEPQKRWHWVQQYFDSHLPVRQAEYHEALQLNLDHSNIVQIHLLLTNATRDVHLLNELRDPDRKLAPCSLGFRITYKAAVQYINAHLAGKLVVLTNADISMYSGFDLVDESAINKRMYAPARWEPATCPNKFECACDIKYGTWGACADSYIFRAPLPAAIVSGDQLDFWLGGRLGGENVFMWEVANQGYQLSNPCRTLVLYHHHCSNLRPHSYEPAARVNLAGRSRDSGHSSTLDRQKKVH